MASDRNFVGRFSVYPDETGRRMAEGGRRLRSETPRDIERDGPLVTIITVCWNSAATIEQTIKSVSAQTYRNIDYVIVDGGSADGTIDILRRHETSIDYFVSEPDDGLYYAMNKGLELAKGDYILILNSDDWYTPDCVASLVAAVTYSGCDFSSALATYVDEASGKTETLRSMPFDHSQLLRMSLRHETMMIPAAIYNDVGKYDTQYRILSDRDFTARLFECGATAYEIQRPLLMFRTSGVSNTNIELLKQEKDLLLQARFPFLTEEERLDLNDPARANPITITDIATRHREQPELVKACRALAADRKRAGGKKWRSADLRKIVVSGPETLPKVSVILPFYEAEDCISRAIDSVLKQSLAEIELICINDCAIDRTEEIVKTYAARDSRIKLIQNAENLGLGASRNIGVKIACGHYVFHLDPDDSIPLDALEHLYKAAINSGAVMVKGAYRASQGLHEQKSSRSVVKYPCGIKDYFVENTDLKASPKLLATTEGHWSFLYEAEFARQVPYPTDLKMGQDSIFLVNALARASSVTLIPHVVYNYEDNPHSTMNRFSAQKFMDAIEWRRRAWRVLKDWGHREIGDTLLLHYWSDAFFSALDAKLDPKQRQAAYNKLNSVFREADLKDLSMTKSNALRKRIPMLSLATPLRTHSSMSAESGNTGTALSRPLRVAIFSTRDHGGAGLGSQRRAHALRRHGVNAEIYCLFKHSHKPYVHLLPPRENVPDELDLEAAWKKHAVITRQEYPDLTARELFSKTDSVVSFDDLHGVIEAADIVHMHWVVGVFDFMNAPKLLADKPVVWTLADMNAFTGGCHYSEGCAEFKGSCRSCPLLNENAAIAYANWSVKKVCYDQLRNLHIICPSQWLADRVKSSSLFGDRPVHVIPNALPVERFKPTNKFVARQKLGLPQNKKLVVFGADSLNNHRKGGDLLRQAFLHLREQGALRDVEGIVFGARGLDLGVKTHSMGKVGSDVELSLIFAAADVFAFPSREDNAPLTVPESLLSGTPVVAFPVGNVPEIVNHLETGYIAEELNIPDFANGLLWALQPREKGEDIMLSIKCHNSARRYNDPDLAARRHINLYKQILSAAEPKQKAPTRRTA